MPYIDPEKEREKHRRYRARKKEDPEWVEKNRARRRAQNKTAKGKEWNRWAMWRWYHRHVAKDIPPIPTKQEREREA
jgi:hypothetical protein